MKPHNNCVAREWAVTPATKHRQTRPPRERSRYPAWVTMTKCVAIALAILLLSGCRGATTTPDLDQQSVDGEYLIPHENLSPRITELADSLERLPRNASRSKFETALAASGLNRKPDWYKDFQNFWCFDANSNSETSPEKTKYVISIGYLPKEDSTIVPYDAGIHRVYPAEPWRKTIWQIEWPLEPAK